MDQACGTCIISIIILECIMIKAHACGMGLLPERIMIVLHACSLVAINCVCHGHNM